MSIVNYRPFAILEDINQLLNERAKNRNADPSTVETSQWNPLVDITETPEHFNLHVDLPGVKKEDIQIFMEDGLLTIRGTRKAVKEETDKNKQVHRIEREFGEFYRKFSLPASADANAIEAAFKDGVLNLEIGKIEKSKTGLIEIK